jgi:fatty acid desaturase
VPVLNKKQQLARTFARMSEVTPGQGLFHAVIHTMLLIGLGGAATIFWQRDFRLAVVVTIPLAVIYTAVLVTGHDCIHRTYTGIKGFDDRWPLIWSWMVYWPHKTYAEIHKLHHAMLGRDFEDPERPTFLKSEFERAGLLMRWYIRHQWLINIFIFGGIGFIIRQWRIGSRLREKYPQFVRAMHEDAFGIVVVASMQLLAALYFDVIAEFLLTYLIVERIVGGLLQMRAMSEHYGLWEGRHADETFRLAMSCRNIKASWFTRWLFNDLCFHSIHHVYPSIPWYKLGEAHLTLPSYWDSINIKAIEPRDSYAKVLGDGIRSWRILPDMPPK